MALVLPGAIYDPLGPQSEPKMAAHDVLCIHTMAGTFKGTEAMFEREGFHGTDSHFGLRADGYLEQWQDLMYQVDANLDGNNYCISFECEDRGGPFPPWSGSDVPAFTIEQMNSLVHVLDILCSKEFHRNCPSDWACHNNGIPRILIPDSKRSRRGIGYHRLGIDPWRVSGGVKWSSATGKACPGDRRIKQIKENIVPRVASEAEDVTPGEHDAIMDTNHRNNEIYKALRGDSEADPKLVNGIKDLVRDVLDFESAQTGSKLRVMIDTITKDNIEEALANFTPTIPDTSTEG